MLTKGALDGYTVLDLSRLLPGPYCSMILADHGARVIAIEDRRFLADDLYFTPVNRNKEHMTLNLKTDKGQKILHELAERADVLLEGFRPGVVKRLGADYETIRKINPKLVYCSITGYGQNGSFRDRPGHDVNYLSQAGVLDLVGETGRPPSIPGVQIADMAGGGMNAAIGILMALLSHEKTGDGQYIDISMTDGMVGLLPLAEFFQTSTGAPLERGQWVLSHRYACYNTYATCDGRYIAVGAVENRFWQRLCDHLGVPEYGPAQYDDARRHDIISHLREIFAAKSLARWETELTPLDVCVSGVRTMAEVYDAPLFREREMIVPMADPDNRVHMAIGVPVKMSATPGSVRTPPVDFGASTTGILTSLGYTSDQIEDLSDSGVI